MLGRLAWQCDHEVYQYCLIIKHFLIRLTSQSTVIPIHINNVTSKYIQCFLIKALLCSHGYSLSHNRSRAKLLGHSFQVRVKKGLHVLHDFKRKRLLIQSYALFKHFQTLAESSLINKQWYYNRRFVSYFKYSPQNK